MKSFIKKLGLALLTNFLVFFLFVYVNSGYIFYLNLEYLPDIGIEFLLSFVFLVSLFWSHSRIANFMRADKVRKFPPLIRSIIEALLVILSTVVLIYITLFYPTFYIFGMHGELPEGRVRTVVVISVVISLFFYYLIEREKSRKKLEEERLRAEQLQKENFKAQLNYLKAQMDPHFLFNSLNVLNSLIYLDQEKATAFTRQLAQVYRSFLNKSDKKLVTLKEEMKLVRNYIGLLQTRFGEDLSVKVHVPTTYSNYQLPPGAVQMLVENAVKHNGFSSQKHLYIDISVESGQIVVRNNLRERKDTPQKSRHGLHNIKSRYAFLTEEKVVINKTDDEFIVKLPLLKAQDENTDH